MEDQAVGRVILADTYVVPGSKAEQELQHWFVQDKVELGEAKEAPDSSSAPWYGVYFYSTLQGCDKPLQGALNHPIEDA